MSITVETVYQIWDDVTGDHIEIGSDLDGLGLIEIRLYDGIKVSYSIGITEEQAKHVADAILNLIKGEA